MKNRQLSFAKFEGIGKLKNFTIKDDHYTAILETKRLSGVIDCVPLYIPKLFGNDFVDISNSDCTVKINGEIENFLERDKNNKQHFNVCVYVKDYEIINITDATENKCHIMAFLCKKLECRETPKGRIVTDLTVVVNHRKGCNYLPVIAWGKHALSISDECSIGDKVELIGRFQSREYVKDETTFMTYEISASNICANDNNESVLDLCI